MALWYIFTKNTHKIFTWAIKTKLFLSQFFKCVFFCLLWTSKKKQIIVAHVLENFFIEYFFFIASNLKYFFYFFLLNCTCLEYSWVYDPYINYARIYVICKVFSHLNKAGVGRWKLISRWENLFQMICCSKTKYIENHRQSKNNLKYAAKLISSSYIPIKTKDDMNQSPEWTKVYLKSTRIRTIE